MNKTLVHTVAFHHFGGGGNNHKMKFVGENKSLIDFLEEGDIIVSTDEEGNELPDEEWQWIDGGGNVLLEGRENIYSQTGRLDRDWMYDTVDVIDINDLDQREIENLYYNEYLVDDTSLSDELAEYVVSWLGYKYVKNVTFDETAMAVCLDDLLVSVEGMEGYTEEKWRDEFDDVYKLTPNTLDKVINVLRENDLIED